MSRPNSRKETTPISEPSAKKASKKKSARKKNKADKNDNEKIFENENAQAKVNAGANAGDAFGYSNLAQQTLDLWREQLTNFLNNPEALNDLNKAAQPAASLLSPMFSPFLTRGMDIWMMMLEQFSKVANTNTFDASGGQDDKKEHAAEQSGNANRATAASALSGASTYAVAQLASRLAELEKRFAEFEGSTKPVSKKPAAKKKTAAAAMERIKRAR